MSGTIHCRSDGLETRAPPHYKVHISVSTILVMGKKISRAVRSYKGCLETPTVVELTTESASVKASAVVVQCAKSVVSVLLSALCE